MLKVSKTGLQPKPLCYKLAPLGHHKKHKLSLNSNVYLSWSTFDLKFCLGSEIPGLECTTTGFSYPK